MHIENLLQMEWGREDVKGPWQAQWKEDMKECTNSLTVTPCQVVYQECLMVGSSRMTRMNGAFSRECEVIIILFKFRVHIMWGCV